MNITSPNDTAACNGILMEMLAQKRCKEACAYLQEHKELLEVFIKTLEQTSNSQEAQSQGHAYHVISQLDFSIFTAEQISCVHNHFIKHFHQTNDIYQSWREALEQHDIKQLLVLYATCPGAEVRKRLLQDSSFFFTADIQGRIHFSRLLEHTGGCSLICALAQISPQCLLEETSAGKNAFHLAMQHHNDAALHAILNLQIDSNILKEALCKNDHNYRTPIQLAVDADKVDMFHKMTACFTTAADRQILIQSSPRLLYWAKSAAMAQAILAAFEPTPELKESLFVIDIFHKATELGNIEVIKLLLTGRDSHVLLLRNRQEKTPLDIALQYHGIPLVEKILALIDSADAQFTLYLTNAYIQSQQIDRARALMEQEMRAQHMQEYLTAACMTPAIATTLVLHDPYAIAQRYLQEKVLVQLTKEQILALLPFLPPADIVKTIHQLSEEEKQRHLALSIEVEGGTMPLEQALIHIRKGILQYVAWQDLREESEQLEGIKDFLYNIPLVSLSIMASKPELQEVVIDYIRAFEEPCIAVCLPHLALEPFLSLMQQANCRTTQDYLLPFATEQQKEAFLSSFPLSSVYETFEQHKMQFEDKLTNIGVIADGGEKEQAVQALQREWRKYGAKLGMSEAIELQTEATAKALLGKNVTPAFAAIVEKEKQAAMKRIATIKQNIALLSSRIFANFERDSPPEEFIDFVTNNLMDIPLILPGGKRIDQETFSACGYKNPFTNEKYTLEEIANLQVDTALQQRITEWRQQHN